LSVLGILASGRGSNCTAILRAERDGRLQARVGLVLSDNPEAPVLNAARALGVESPEPASPRPPNQPT
jgi:phosphoribosylglycinamide formyltransferase-1